MTLSATGGMDPARDEELESATHWPGGDAPPRVSGGLPLLGHLLEMRRSPIALFQRVRDQYGELGEIRLARNRVVMLYGEEAQEAFFRAPDEQLDQAAAYPFMTPIFGRGVVFDATPEQRKQALRNQSLRDKMMRGHAEVIAAETERAIARLGERGEIDLLDFFAELTLYTSSACLIGKSFREELTRGARPDLPRSREGHRRLRLRESLPAAALVPPPRRRAPASGRDPPGHLREARGGGRRRTGICSPCCARSSIRTAARATPSTSSPGCSSR